MSVKTIIASATFIALTSVSVAHAANLKITNHTKRDSTTLTNDGACSTILGESGITRAAKPDGRPTVNEVTLENVAKACAASIIKKVDCKADVYMNDHCGAPKVATVYFDIQKRGKEIVGTGLRKDKTSIYDKSYQVGGEGFDLAILGGPTLSKK